MRVLALVLTAVVLAGCASRPAIHVQQDPAMDSGNYRTYAWMQQPPVSNPMLRQKLVAAIDAELADKGWRQAPDDEAQVLLVGNVSSLDDASLNYFHEHGGVERIELRVLQFGTLVLDAFDAHTHRAIWRGLAQGQVPDSDAQRSRAAMTAVRRMFRKFPEAARDRR